MLLIQDENQQGFWPISRLFFWFETQNINRPHKNVYWFLTIITETTNMELLPKYVSCASSQKLLHFEDVPIKSLK